MFVSKTKKQVEFKVVSVTNKNKKAAVLAKVKREKGEDLSKKEYEAILATLRGPFGRMR